MIVVDKDYKVKKTKKQNRTPKPLPSRQRLHELFEYDFDTGQLYWKVGKCAGQEAGFLNQQGYRIVDLKNERTKRRQSFKVHRIIFYMFTGKPLTKFVIDHIDGSRSNNRLSNLRAVKQKCNLKNTETRRRNGCVPSQPQETVFFN